MPLRWAIKHNLHRGPAYEQQGNRTTTRGTLRHRRTKRKNVSGTGAGGTGKKNVPQLTLPLSRSSQNKKQAAKAKLPGNDTRSSDACGENRFQFLLLSGKIHNFFSNFSTFSVQSTQLSLPFLFFVGCVCGGKIHNSPTTYALGGFVSPFSSSVPTPCEWQPSRFGSSPRPA